MPDTRSAQLFSFNQRDSVTINDEVPRYVIFSSPVISPFLSLTFKRPRRGYEDNRTINLKEKDRQWFITIILIKAVRRLKSITDKFRKKKPVLFCFLKNTKDKSAFSFETAVLDCSHKLARSIGYFVILCYVFQLSRNEPSS